MASPVKRKPKPKRKKLEKSQAERFTETARELGVRTGEAFERVFRALVPPKRHPK